MIGIKQVVSGLLSGGLKEVGNIVDSVVTTKEEKQQLHNKLKQLEMKQELDLKQMDLDRFGQAQATYRKDSDMQKIYALVFLVAYVGLTVYLIWVLITKTGIPDYALTLISSFWGAMSSKVNTITDFFFGSSASSQSKDESLKNLNSMRL